MLSKEELTRFIRENKHDVYIDGSGRLMFRSPGSSYLVEPIIDRGIKGCDSIEYTLNRNILHYEDRISRKPLTPWLKSELSILQSVNLDSIGQLKEVAVTLNQASLIFTFFGDLRAATKLCYESIAFYNNIQNRYPENNPIKWALQPWINLSRLDRIQGKAKDSLGKITFLSGSASSLDPIRDYERIIKKAFNVSYQKDKGMTNVIDNCLVLEPVKTYLQAKNYINVLELPTGDITSYTVSIQMEAKIISLVSLDRLQEALNVANNCFCHGCIPVTHIFAFRRAEILFLMGATYQSRQEVDKLVSLVNKFDYEKNINLNELNFVLSLMKLLQAHRKEEEAGYLARKCYDAFDLLDDEVGKITALKHLIQLTLASKISNSKHNEQLERMVSQTEYCFVRQKHDRPLKTNKLLCERFICEFMRLYKLFD